MPGTRCLNCRWWNGDKKYAAECFTERDRHGKCESIISSMALRDDTSARIYPAVVGAWVNTRFDFSCARWEKE